MRVVPALLGIISHGLCGSGRKWGHMTSNNDVVLWALALLGCWLGASALIAVWVLYRMRGQTRPATPKALDRASQRGDLRWQPQGELLTGGIHSIPREGDDD